MKKIIRMKRCVFDSYVKELQLDHSINKTSHLLTKLFFGEGHPLREKLREKVFDEDIDARLIKLGVGGYAKYTKHPKTGKRWVLFNVTEICLWVTMKDHRGQEDHRNEMQTMYIQGKLNEYMNEQGFSVPCKEVDEIELFLHYLEQYIPCIWDYFKVFKQSNTEQQMAEIQT